LFDIGAMRLELRRSLGVPVDVLTPGALPEHARDHRGRSPARMNRHPQRLRDHLQHIVQAGQRIQGCIDGLDESAFGGDTLRQDAVIRKLQMIGEASRNLLRDHPNFAASNPLIVAISCARRGAACCTQQAFNGRRSSTDERDRLIDAAWLLFIVASLVVIVTPGQDMVLVMSRSIAQGSAAGVVTAAGVSVGLVGHTVLATLGLGALLRASEWLFLVLKLAGAAYLVYIGVQLLRAGAQQIALAAAAPRPLGRLFADGALSNLSNPKIAVFYFAFLPQFVPADAAQPTLSMFVLGLVFAALTFIVKGPVGLTAGALSGWLRSRPRVLVGIGRTSGAVLVGLGVKLAFEPRP
jgi:threonine/homoserine/homoserine lactone efflux protein